MRVEKFGEEIARLYALRLRNCIVLVIFQLVFEGPKIPSRLVPFFECVRIYSGGGHILETSDRWRRKKQRALGKPVSWLGYLAYCKLTIKESCEWSTPSHVLPSSCVSLVVFCVMKRDM